MAMRGIHVLVSVVALALGLTACNKPSEESCRHAIENMQKLIGSEGLTTDIDAQVRRCRGGSSRKAVECATAARTREELMACEFVKFDTQRSDDAPGSAQ
jgi:hypothetical protein